MKKILSLFVLMLLAISSNCFAMTFSQPVKIGFIFWSQRGGGFLFQGEDSNDGIKKDYHDYYKKYTYSKGVARYGNGADALYIYYDEAQGEYCNVGGNNINNTQRLGLFCAPIHKITSDEGITLYLIGFLSGPIDIFDIIGRQKDGKWVKYIDCNDLTINYFGKNELGVAKYMQYSVPICQGNTLITKYRYPKSIKDNGEMRFKWDEAAQWFGVEQVVY